MILIIDDEAICREPIAATLRLAGFETREAADGNEGLRLAQEKRPKLIVLDANMPKKNGVEFLKDLRADASLAGVPVIMLTANSSKDAVAAIGKLGVRDYLLKARYSTRELIQRIQKYVTPVAPKSPQTLAVAAVPTGGGPVVAPPVVDTPVITPAKADAPKITTPASQNAAANTLSLRDESIQRMKKVTSGRALGGVVSQVLQLAASPYGDATQLAGVISRDPVLASKVLAIANSAAYASRGVSLTIIDAVRKIGFASVRNIAAAVGIFGSLPSMRTPLFDALRCWQHSFAVATLLERAEQIRDPSAASHAFLTGLCHDLGELLVQTEFTQEYIAIHEQHQRDSTPIRKLQRERLGASHEELVLAAVSSVGLPDMIRLPIEMLLRSAKSGDAISLRRAALLRICDRLANGYLLGMSENAPVCSFEKTQVIALMGHENAVEVDPASFRQELNTLTAVFSRLGPEECRSLVYPVTKTNDIIYYIREPGLSRCDPLESMLKEFGTVQEMPKFPRELLGTSGRGSCILSTRSEMPTHLQNGVSAFLTSRGDARSKLLWCPTDPPTAQPSSAIQIAEEPTFQFLSEFVGATSGTGGQQRPIR